MNRVVPTQPDLIAPDARSSATPEVDPLAELSAMLAMLRAADRLPWRDAAATMAEERRALGLTRLAGAEGQRLAAAILEETERLFAAVEAAEGRR